MGVTAFMKLLVAALSFDWFAANSEVSVLTFFIESARLTSRSFTSFSADVSTFLLDLSVSALTDLVTSKSCCSRSVNCDLAFARFLSDATTKSTFLL